MRKIYLPILLLCLNVTMASAQNWQAFVSGRTYHYKSDTAVGLPDQSVHFDSVEVLGADSAFSVARRFVFPVDTSQRNQPMFCGRDIRAHADGTFNFRNPMNVGLKTRASFGSFFALDSISGLTATVSRVYQGMVLGLTLDSIKVFTTQTLDSLVLSKNHGILEWPASLGGNRFRLSGIQEDGLGEVLPAFDGFFNYAAGDEYFFESEITTGDFVEDQQVFRVRFHVDTNQRVMGGSHVHWTGFVRHESYLGGNLQSIVAALDSGNFMLHARPEDILNKSHHEQVRAPRALASYSLPSPWATYNVTAAVDSMNADWNGLWSTMTFQKIAGKTELHFGRSNGAVGWLYRGIGGDTCVRSNDDQIRATFREGMGITHVEFGGVFMHGHFDLVGSIINGDTTGRIFADTVITASDKPTTAALRWNAFPNPAHDRLTVQCADARMGKVELMDLSGKLMVVAPLLGLGAELDVRDLPVGMYVLRLTQGSVQSTRRISILH